MYPDAIPNASVAVASSNPKEFVKKKRANRLAKLKQCKLDARREQWLSQVRNKSGSKEDVSDGGMTSQGQLLHLENEKGRSFEKLEIKPRSVDSFGDISSMNNYSDSESFPSNSPTSHTSSVLDSHDSGTSFNVRISQGCSSTSSEIDRGLLIAQFSTSASSISNGSSSGRSSSSSSTGFCPGNMSGDDEGDTGDDDCLDDWEAVADALAASEDKHQVHSANVEVCTAQKHDVSAKSVSQVDVTNGPFSEIDISNANHAEIDISNANHGMGVTTNQRDLVKCCAWRPDDACRPQSLPNLSKQYSLPLKSELHFGRQSVWGCKNLGPIATSCPICAEDFDYTDSSFLPCPCGFRICLFCHKRILEEDGRCPGCRKHYEHKPVEGEATLDGGSLTFRVTRTCSMVARS